MNQKVTLIIYPCTTRIAYVLCQDANNILDFGIKPIRPITSAMYLQKLKWILDYAEPNVIIFRGASEENDKISKKIKIAMQIIIQEIEKRNLATFYYSRREIKEVFQLFDSKNKYEIAIKLCEWYPQLTAKKPVLRKAFMNEDHNMAIFDAFALMVVHFYLVQ